MKRVSTSLKPKSVERVSFVVTRTFSRNNHHKFGGNFGESYVVVDFTDNVGGFGMILKWIGRFGYGLFILFSIF